MVKNYEELHVYENGMSAALEIFKITKTFPSDERYSMVSQIRKSSRSVCANIGEAWRRRRYRAAFIAKLNDVETEANETRVWLDIAVQCEYLSRDLAETLKDKYDHIISQIVIMIDSPDVWLIKERCGAEPPTRRSAVPLDYSSEKR